MAPVGATTLPRFGIFAAMLAAAGLPIYIHAPKFLADEYGINLTAVGATFVILRLLDVVQDPLLGRLASSLGRWRVYAANIAALGMAVGMIGLFVVAAPISPILWMSICLVLLFTNFSFLSILFYARGVSVAERLGAKGHVRLAGWRETGALLGVTLACIAPFIFLQLGAGPYSGFALAFCALVLIAAVSMRNQWQGSVVVPKSDFATLLSDNEILRLLLIAALNAAPVAVTSTLFLFFVEYRLGQADFAGIYLLSFFLAAACAAPFWSRLARRFSAINILAAGMVLSIIAFAWAGTLGMGDGLAFFIVCVLSGAALGADMTLLPALFAEHVSRANHDSSRAFGLWNFSAKIMLAVAAAVVLPLLEQGGFRVGIQNDAPALARLSILYAVLPCILKFFALAVLIAGPKRKSVLC